MAADQSREQYLGRCCLAFSKTALVFLRVNAFWFQIITGLMIVAAVLLDGAIKRFVKTQPTITPQGV